MGRLGYNTVSKKVSAKLSGALELGRPTEIRRTTLLPLGGPGIGYRLTLGMGIICKK